MNVPILKVRNWYLLQSVSVGGKLKNWIYSVCVKVDILLGIKEG